MAKILGGGTFGELRGKLGSLVFSRNASAAYVRAYALPVNPNTTAQSLARGQFSQVIQRWHALTDSQKSMWNTYANSYNFSSGINAFTSLQNRVQNNIRLSNANSVYGTFDGDEAITEGSYFLGNEPPATVALIPPFLVDSINVVGAEFDITQSKIEIEFDLAFATSGSSASPIKPDTGFVDGFSPAGISAYLSLPEAQAVQFFNNPNYLKIGVLPPISSVTAGATPTPSTGVAGNKIEGDLTGKLSTMASALGNSFFSKVTFFFEGASGRKLLIGSQPVQFESAT